MVWTLSCERHACRMTGLLSSGIGWLWEGRPLRHQQGAPKIQKSMTNTGVQGVQGASL